MSDAGFVRPLQLDEYTARRIVAAVVLQAFKDVEAWEKRQQRDPQAKPKACERDAAAWLASQSTAPFSYRWCCGVLDDQPRCVPSSTPG